MRKSIVDRSDFAGDAVNLFALRRLKGTAMTDNAASLGKQVIIRLNDQVVARGQLIALSGDPVAAMRHVLQAFGLDMQLASPENPPSPQEDHDA